MVQWSDGYVTSIDYTWDFIQVSRPSPKISVSCSKALIRSPIGEGFSYCELGCGHGFSTTLLAAANPKGSFWGVDYNPAHIAGAERLAAVARIENITFSKKVSRRC